MSDNDYYEAELIKLTESLLKCRSLLARAMPYVELHEEKSANEFGRAALSLYYEIKGYLKIE